MNSLALSSKFFTKKVFSLKKGDAVWSKRGKSVSDDFLMVRALPKNDVGLHFGLIVKKKMGNAVVRNLIKRRLRHAFLLLSTKHAELTHKALSYLVIIKKREVAFCSFDSLYQRLSLLVCMHGN